jgi:ribosomal protein L24
MTAAQLDRIPMGTSVVFTCGRLKGAAGKIVDVRHEGHHVRVTLEGGQTVSTRPGAIKDAEK